MQRSNVDLRPCFSTVMPHHLHKRMAGFTLIEVLVTTMILSMVIYLAVVSYSMFLDRWARNRLSNQRDMEGYRAHVLARYAIESISDYYVTSRNAERFHHFFPYFKGTPDAMEFITISPLISCNIPALVRISFQKNKMDNGSTFDLVYEEMALENRYLHYWEDQREFSRSVLLYSNLEGGVFRYHGIKEIRWNQDVESFQSVYGWYDKFSGRNKNTIPDMIELTLEREQAKISLLYPVRAYNAAKKVLFNPTAE